MSGGDYNLMISKGRENPVESTNTSIMSVASDLTEKVRDLGHQVH